jgi:PAS domain S-box-containing protein
MFIHRDTINMLCNVYSQGYDKYGSKKFVNNFTYPVDKLSLDKKVIKSKKSMLISDTYQDSRWIIFKETSWIRSRLSMPVCLGNKVIGLLNLDDDTPGKFVKDDIKKLQPLVNAAAIALENARLFEEVRKEISERKKAEKALVGSEEKYRTIFENTGTAVIIIEEDKTISMANTQSEKLSGYSKEEIENKIKWTDFVIPEDLKVMVDYHTARRKAGENPPTEYEFHFIDRKGKIKNILLKVGIIPGSKKSIASLVDVTKHKQAEEALRESEERYRFIAEQPGQMIYDYNIVSGEIDWSGDVEGVTGFNSEDFQRVDISSWENLIHPDDRENALTLLDNAMKNGEKYDMNYRFKCKDGIYKFIEDNGFFLLDKDGKAYQMLGIMKDITERKQSEERLKKTMDAAIDTMSRIIEAKDPYTSGHQHRVCQLAVLLARELGLSEDKIEGVRIASLIHDIGKIGLPTEILSKPTKLADIEFRLIKGHSQIGYDILKSIDFSYPIAEIVLQHHERINGSGYPNGLRASPHFRSSRCGRGNVLSPSLSAGLGDKQSFRRNLPK